MSVVRVVLGFAATLWAASGLTGAAVAQGTAPQPGLTAFSTDTALRNFLRDAIAEERRRNMAEYGQPLPPPPPPPPPPAPGAGPAPGALGITNTQVAGVDEGGIVKVRGDILVVLSRGRLFTVSLAGGGMRPIASINAFPPGVDGRGDWYDEMLIAGDRVVVIGYSYRRSGTQVNRFRLDAAGALTFEDSYQLRSNDYYSSRNYASRLIGNRLILYAPLYLNLERDPFETLPAMRQWQAGADAGAGAWRRITSASRVYVPNALRDHRAAKISALHSVTSCDLAAPRLDCEATVVLGGPSRSFFVSGNAVYLWASDVWRQRRGGAFVYRIPFDGGRPSALQARGAPIDQFSFLPDAARGALHVVVRAFGSGDAMWRPEVTYGDVALLTIPMGAFGDGAREVALDQYQPLPRPGGNAWNFHNRFVGDHLLYSGGSTGQAGAVTVVSLADRSVAALPVTHGIDRIDAIGPDAVVIGGGQNALGFTAIRLPAEGARVGEAFLLPNAREGESRSHAFYFRPDQDSADGASGLLGLPVARVVPVQGRPYPSNSAAMLFLSRRDGRLAQAGELAAAATAGSNMDDGCQSSCVDWYGNARPIFLGERIFALLGYELVEGARRDGRIAEIGRASFAPRPEGRAN